MKNQILRKIPVKIPNNVKYDIEVKDTHCYFADNILVHNCKADGMFCNINVYQNGTVEMFSRSGKEIPVESYESIANEFKSKGFGLDFEFHGELLVKIDGEIAPREIGNGILNSVNSGKGQFEDNQEPIFMVWDIVPLEHIKAKGKYEIPYIERLKTLTVFFGPALGWTKNPINVIETKSVKNMDEAMNHYRDCISRGLEGTILKKSSAIWKDGTSKEMFKLKIECDISLRVVGIEMGREHSKNEGRPAAMLLRSEDDKLRVSVTMKGDAMIDYIEANPDEYIDKIVEVRANAIMKPTGKNQYYSLFLPRLVEADYRRDKKNADTFQKIQDQFDSLVKV